MKRFVIMKGEYNFGTDYNEYTAKELRNREKEIGGVYSWTFLETFDEDKARRAFAELKNTAYFTGGYAFKHTVYVTCYCLTIEEGELDENGNFDCDDIIEDIDAEFDSETYTA